ncbi:hypothetical protein [Mumia quercus]|uniref:hypothetical protein n=1 Tax=Mumia quercus TaxID=2976125 RepID=UPI0021D18474|nr:hypothetical protein [Mumia quercus]
MGAAGLAAGIVLVLAVLALGVVAVAGAVLLLTGVVAHQRRGSAPLLWAGAGALGLVSAVVTWTFVWAQLAADPDTLRVDLREPVTVASLDKDDMPGYPGAYEYESDRVELVLPDGSLFRSQVYTATLWADDEVVRSISLSQRAMPTDEAVEAVRAWADELDARPIGLETAAGTVWTDSVLAGGLDAELSLQPIGSGAESRAFLTIEVVTP